MSSIWCVPVIEEQLWSAFDVLISEYTDAVVPIDHNHFCVTVGFVRVIGKTNFVTLSSRVDGIIYEEK